MALTTIRRFDMGIPVHPDIIQTIQLTKDQLAEHWERPALAADPAELSMMEHSVQQDAILVVLTEVMDNSSKPGQPRLLVRSLILTKEHPVVPIGRSSKTSAKGYNAAPENAYFDNAVMSRNHAELEADFSTLTVSVRDQGSLHGTFYQCLARPDAEVKLGKDERRKLKTGDQLQFGVPIFRTAQSFPPLKVKVELKPKANEESQPPAKKCTGEAKSRGFTMYDPLEVDDDSSVAGTDDQEEHEPLTTACEPSSIEIKAPPVPANATDSAKEMNVAKCALVDLTEEPEAPEKPISTGRFGLPIDMQCTDDSDIDGEDICDGLDSLSYTSDAGLSSGDESAEYTSREMGDRYSLLDDNAISQTGAIDGDEYDSSPSPSEIVEETDAETDGDIDEDLNDDTDEDPDEDLDEDLDEDVDENPGESMDRDGGNDEETGGEDVIKKVAAPAPGYTTADVADILNANPEKVTGILRNPESTQDILKERSHSGTPALGGQGTTLAYPQAGRSVDLGSLMNMDPYMCWQPPPPPQPMQSRIRQELALSNPGWSWNQRFVSQFPNRSTGFQLGGPVNPSSVAAADPSPAYRAEALGNKSGKWDYFKAREENRMQVPPPTSAIRETLSLGSDSHKQGFEYPKRIRLDGLYRAPSISEMASNPFLEQRPQVPDAPTCRPGDLQFPLSASDSPELDMTSADKFARSKRPRVSPLRLKIQDLLCNKEAGEGSQGTPMERHEAQSPVATKRSFDQAFEEEIEAPDVGSAAPKLVEAQSADSHGVTSASGSAELEASKESSAGVVSPTKATQENVAPPQPVQPVDASLAPPVYRPTKKRRLAQAAAYMAFGGASVLSALILTAPSLS